MRQRIQLLPGIIVAVVVVVILTVVIGFVININDYRAAIKEMPRRRVETKTVILNIYDFRAQTGEWPSDASAIQPDIPKGWTYEYYSAEDPPTLVLFGPFHLVLRYCFSDLGDRESSGEWVFRSEGSRIELDSKLEESSDDGEHAVINSE